MAFGKSPAFLIGPPTEKIGWRVGLHGNPGTGKSSMCAYAPRAAMVDVERGFRQLRLGGRIPCVQPATWPQLMDSVALTGANALPWRDHDTIIVDSLTACERMASEYVLNGPGYCGDAQKYNSFGRGTADTFLLMERLRHQLEAHHVAGRNVVCVCHSRDGERTNTEGTDTKYIEISLNSGDKTNTAKAFLNWFDAVGCVYFPATTSENIRRADTGRRCIEFTAGLNFDAKNRIDGNPDIHTISSNGKGPDEKQMAEFWRLLLPKNGVTENADTVE